MRDREHELNEYAAFDRHGKGTNVPGNASAESATKPDYSEDEIRRNRFWNVVLTIAALAAIAAMWATEALPSGGAIAIGVLIVGFSLIYRWLFASKAAAKLDEDSAGSGKRVGPTTMGTILGYLNDGFKW